MSPTGVRSGRRAPARGNGGPPSGRGAVLRVSGRTRPVTGDTTPYDQRPAELHNPRITQATYMSIWESAHLAGRRCRVEIRPPYRAPVPCGNPPTLPGAGAVWKSAHLAGRRCRVGIRPPCRAPVLCGNSPIFMTKICQMTGSCVLIYVRRDFAYQLLRTEIFLNHQYYT
ncbi:hypothetical protein AZ034_005252 [Pluralibacter gergoviae]|nr:hypothetical protein AZ034_005252 [Pluralibacter gergoviae]